MPRARQQPSDALAAFESRLRLVRSSDEPDLEELFTGAHYFGVDTATDLQRAVCRIADGKPLGALEYGAHVREALSHWSDRSRAWRGGPIARPRELVYVAGTRSGKTRFAAAQAVRLARTADLAGLKEGEVACVPVVSLLRKLAREAFSQLCATVLAKPKLRRYLVGEPLADSLVIRNRSGRPVRIEVVAGRRAGASLISRWLVGAIFDEAPRMSGSDDGSIINLDDSLAAIQSRIRPGGQVMLIGSPWAPSGPVYQRVNDHHGQPTDRVCVVRAKAPWLNPVTWTEEVVERLRRSDSAVDQVSYQTDCLAEFCDPESGLFTASEVDAAMSGGQTLGPEDDVLYAAAMDPAVRLNAWTLVVKKRAAGRDVVVLCKQWHRHGQDPEDVLSEIAKTLSPYRVKHVATDKWQVDTLTSLARGHGLSLVEMDYAAAELTQLYLDMQVKIAQGLVSLPADPDLRADLLSAKKVVTRSGMSIELPVGSTGRHGDYVPALARCLRQHVPDSEPMPRPKEDLESRLERLAIEKFTPRRPKTTRERVEHRWRV